MRRFWTRTSAAPMSVSTTNGSCCSGVALATSCSSPAPASSNASAADSNGLEGTWSRCTCARARRKGASSSEPASASRSSTAARFGDTQRCGRSSRRSRPSGRRDGAPAAVTLTAVALFSSLAPLSTPTAKSSTPAAESRTDSPSSRRATGAAGSSHATTRQPSTGSLRSGTPAPRPSTGMATTRSYAPSWYRLHASAGARTSPGRRPAGSGSLVGTSPMSSLQLAVRSQRTTPASTSAAARGRSSCPTRSTRSAPVPRDALRTAASMASRPPAPVSAR